MLPTNYADLMQMGGRKLHFFVQLSNWQSKATQTKSRLAVSAHLSVLPPCIWTSADVSTRTHARVVIWWLNLDRVELAAKTTELAKLFEEPRVSTTLRNNYDPSKPTAIGVFEITPDLRGIRAEDSQSHHILHGGKE
jgi:hypothetical protein